MILKAEPPHCFSSTYYLSLNGHPLGEYRCRWFSEHIDVHLVNQRDYHFRKMGWWGSRFLLVEGSTERVLGEAGRTGFFRSAWDLRLSIGAVRLVSAGIFNTAFTVYQDQRYKAAVDRLGFCRSGWSVEDDGTLAVSDLVLIGLIYHAIVRRRAAAASAAGAGAS